MASDTTTDVAGVSGAYAQILGIQSASSTLQDSMLGLVTSATTALAASADLPTVSIDPVVTPDDPLLVSYPLAPEVPEDAVETPTAPVAPEIETADVGEVEIPVFSDSPPMLNFPTFDDMPFPDAPGAAPEMADITIPDLDAYEIPEAPSWDPIELPVMPGYIVPQFEGERPPLPSLEAPQNAFFYAEGQFSSSLWDALQARLLDDVQNGADLTDVLALAGMFAEQERWVVQQGTQRKEEIRATWAAQGYARLPGAATAQMRLVDLDIEKSLAATRTQATAKQAEIAIQYRQFVIEQSVAFLVNGELARWNQANARGLEAAKVAMEAAYQDVDARVKLFNLALARFQADAAVFEARVKASLTELEAYKSQLEAAKVRGELRQSDVQVYLGKLQAVSQVVEVYKGRLQAAATVAEIQKSSLQAYEVGVQAYGHQVNAVSAQYNARVAQITGEKARAEVYDTQVRAYSALVAGAKTVADIDIARAGFVSDRNKTNATIYASNVEAYRAQWQGVATQVDRLSRYADNLVKVYTAQMQGTSSENDVKIRKYAADIQNFSAQLDASIKQAGLVLDRGKVLAELNERQLAVIAQVAGQALASALGQIHGSAALSSSDSTSSSTSDSTSTSTSTSTSNGNSYSTSYNYNQSMSV